MIFIPRPLRRGWLSLSPHTDNTPVPGQYTRVQVTTPRVGDPGSPMKMLLLLILLPYLVTLEGSRNVKRDARNSDELASYTRHKLEYVINCTTHEEEETRSTALPNWSPPRSPPPITYTTGGIISMSSLLNPVQGNENSEKTITASPDTPTREQIENSLPTPWQSLESTQGNNFHLISDESNNWGSLLPKSLPEPSSNNSMNQYQDGSSSLIRMPEMTVHLCSEKDQSNEPPPTVNSPSSVTTQNNNYGVSATNHTQDQPKQRPDPKKVKYDLSLFTNYVYKPGEGSRGLSRETSSPLISMGVPFENMGAYFKEREKVPLRPTPIGTDLDGSLGYSGSPRKIGQSTWRYSFKTFQVLGRNLTATTAYISQSKQSMLLTATTQCILICNMPPESTTKSINNTKASITKAHGPVAQKNGVGVLQALENIPGLNYICLLQQNMHVFTETDNIRAVLLEPDGRTEVISKQGQSILEAQLLMGKHICLIKVKEQAGLEALLKSLKEYIISSKAPENWSSTGNPEEVILCATLVEDPKVNQEASDPWP